MGLNTVDSSPLSSPTSSLRSPPGAGPEEPSVTATAEASTTPTKQSASDLKAPILPPSPESSKSTASNTSKKRSHAECDDEPSEMPKKKTKQRKQAKPTIAPPSTRPSRNRKAPERFTDTKYEAPPEKPAPPRKPASKVFDPIYITTNANSRLGKADIYHMLLRDEPWTCLTVDQKQTLFSMLPRSSSNVRLLNEIQAGTAAETARPREFGKNFNLFRTDVAKFIEDLRNGHLGKSWQAAAEQAVIQRAEGAFDAWKAEEAEAWWGQK